MRPRLAMILHVGAPAAPHDLATAWTLDPALLASLAIPAFLYWRGARGMARYTRKRAPWFGAGMATLMVALVSPLDAMGEALFSAHMVQHLLLMVVAAPLIVLGEPLAPMLRALPRRARRRVARWGRRGGVVRGTLEALLHPAVVLVAHLAALWAWHLPGPYEAALRHPALHVAEHLSFVVTALGFWWIVLRPVMRGGGEGASVALAFVAIVQSGVLGALITFAPRPWYPAHGPGARLWGISLLTDQQLAGLIMWVPGGAPYLAATLKVVARRLRRDQRPLSPA